MGKTSYQYWGKTKQQDKTTGDNFHLLVYHCLDVAAVGHLLLAPTKPLTKELATFLSLSRETLQRLITFCLALHDLGKFASAFQQFYNHESPLLIQAISRAPYDGRNYRHDMLGQYFWQTIIQDGRLMIPCLEDSDERQKKRVF